MFGFRSAPPAHVIMGVIMGVIGAFSLAAVVNQIAIALCRRAQAVTTETDLDEH